MWIPIPIPIPSQSQSNPYLIPYGIPIPIVLGFCIGIKFILVLVLGFPLGFIWFTRLNSNSNSNTNATFMDSNRRPLTNWGLVDLTSQQCGGVSVTWRVYWLRKIEQKNRELMIICIQRLHSADRTWQQKPIQRLEACVSASKLLFLGWKIERNSSHFNCFPSYVFQGPS